MAYSPKSAHPLDMNTALQSVAVNRAGRIGTRVSIVKDAAGPLRFMTDDNMPMTLSTLITASANWDAEFSEIRLNPDDLRFQPDGILYRGEVIRLDQSARTRAFNRIGAPNSYLEKHTPQFQAAALSEHATRGDFGGRPTLVLSNGELVTIAKGELLSLSNSDTIRAVQDALGTEGETLAVAKIGRDPERLDVELVSPSKAITVRPGDVVQSGLHIVHHRFGNQATVIEAFIHRLICSNGMTRRECVRDGLMRTRKLPVDFPNNRELQMNQIRRLTQQNWNGLQTQLEALRATSERPARVEELLTRWLQRARISVRAMMPRLRAAWREEGAEDTHYGAVNALTRVATHHRDLSERQRRVLASLAGLLAFAEVHICERCFSVLTRSAADTAE
jgi:hypothetical protein